MQSRNELLKWVNERIPVKISKLDVLRDGRQFILLLKRVYPDITLLECEAGTTQAKRVKNLQIFQRYCEQYGICLKVQIEFIAEGNLNAIIFTLKYIKDFIERIEKQKQECKVCKERKECGICLKVKEFLQENRMDEIYELFGFQRLKSRISSESPDQRGNRRTLFSSCSNSKFFQYRQPQQQLQMKNDQFFQVSGFK